MAPPPAKRQKLLTVLNSDKERNGRHASTAEPATNKERSLAGRSSAAALASRAGSRAKSFLFEKDSGSSAGSTPASSPNKPASKQANAGNLQTFFTTVTQTQRVASIPGTSNASQLIEEEEDSIQDDPPVEGLPRQTSLHRSSRASGLGIKAFQRELAEDRPFSGKNIGASQRFLPVTKTSWTNRSTTGSAKVAESKPWAEAFEPLNLEELAVHKKKVADVRVWLDSVLHGMDYKRLLVLKGPSGTGKSATIYILSKLMEFDIVEWKNPMSSEFTSDGFSSLSAQFEDFLGRSGRFSSLTLEDDSTQKNASLSQHPISPCGNSRINQVIVLEEFPNTFSRSSKALTSFRSSIFQYLAATATSTGGFSAHHHEVQTDITPIIMVISETLLTTTTVSADTFTAHRLLGADILNHPRTTVIEFNPIAPTYLVKALQLIIQKEARISGRRRVPGPAVLKKISEIGDIRSAISSLEFLCIKGDDTSDWGGTVAMKSGKGAKNMSTITEMEQGSIEIVTQREASLGIFHAVARVVYNKREEYPLADTRMLKSVQPPEHLSYYSRPKGSVVNVDELMDETGTDTPTFIAALHENYVLSCDGPTYTDNLNSCTEAFSDSDLLNSDRRGGISTRESSGYRMYQGSDAESLRQNEMCFQVAVRGVLFGLPYPVKRRMAAPMTGDRGSVKSDAFKMSYPTSMRLWKQTEVIEALIDRWTDPIACGSDHDTQQPTGSRGRVETWRHKLSSPAAKSSSNAISEDHTAPPILMGGNSARTEMVLERLPYIAKIEHRLPDTTRKRELKTITQLHGIEAPTTDVPDESADSSALLSAEVDYDLGRLKAPKSYTPLLKDEAPLSRTGARKAAQSLGSVVTGNQTQQTLVLTDDDIEDD